MGLVIGIGEKERDKSFFRKRTQKVGKLGGGKMRWGERERKKDREIERGSERRLETIIVCFLVITQQKNKIRKLEIRIEY